MSGTFQVSFIEISKERDRIVEEHGPVAQKLFEGISWHLSHNPYSDVTPLENGAYLYQSYTRTAKAYLMRVAFTVEGKAVLPYKIDLQVLDKE